MVACAAICIAFLFDCVPGIGQLSEDKITEITLAEVTAHIRFLASDELEGRMTGEPGNATAARYIAEQFRAYGLDPVPGSEDFMQPIHLSRTSQSHDNLVVFGQDTLRQGREMLVRQAADLDLTAPILFEEFGAMQTDSASSQNNAGERLAGRIELTYFGTDGNSGTRLGFEAGREKLRVAEANGAVALIELYDGALPWSRLVQFLDRPKYELGEPEQGQDAPRIPHILIDNRDGKFNARLKEWTRGYLFIQTATPDVVTSSNVLAVIPGQDPKLRDEYLFLTAHFDHLGTKSRTEAAEADTIFNGARDNAMGVTALLAAAQTLSHSNPARSIICMACTGEELGLLGSKFYVQNPLVPLEQTIFVLNVDGAGYTDTTGISVIGFARSTAKTAISQAIEALHLQVIADPVPQMNLFNRSDNISFSRFGVPSCSMSPGFHTFGEELEKLYHKVSDEVDSTFDYRYLLKFSQAYARAAFLLASAPDAPQWRQGDEFEPTGKALYRARHHRIGVK